MGFLCWSKKYLVTRCKIKQDILTPAAKGLELLKKANIELELLAGPNSQVVLKSFLTLSRNGDKVHIIDSIHTFVKL